MAQGKERDVPTRTGPRKIVVYQVFARLFGNTNTTNMPWGTIEENGVGKFSDFTVQALQEIRELGVTHIWYTGIPHHAVIRDYTEYGISNDAPDIVKGRAGSPYAVKDYYSVDPDLANDPKERMAEFKALVTRTHAVGLKVIIDIVPNHVARKYEGINNPEGVVDFGATDNRDVTYDKNNNFYYNPGEAFMVPEWRDGYLPLGGKAYTMGKDKFVEIPAKWTGNGSRLSKPDFYDWYETVKINYGIRPDGGKDFDTLPGDFGQRDYSEHVAFWSDKEVPDSWLKFRDIALFWLETGVDGFRYDMAEMVPVEFWSFLNSTIKMKNPETFLLAEVYDPGLYRDYIFKGKMDYLYDKVGFYDGLKPIMQGYGWTDHIPVVQNGLMDIEHRMLHFLENHDELRIPSPDFLGNAEMARPGMLVSATISTSPTMIYFGQEVGEPATGHPGFGSPGRTSIFDYVGVPHLQRWVNHRKFDGGQLSPKERELRNFYKILLNFTINSSALMGQYRDIHFYNRDHTEYYNYRVLSFVRWSIDEKLIIIANFDGNQGFGFDLKLPPEMVGEWDLQNGVHRFKDVLWHGEEYSLTVENGIGHIRIDLEPLESLILSLI